MYFDKERICFLDVYWFKVLDELKLSRKLFLKPQLQFCSPLNITCGTVSCMCHHHEFSTLAFWRTLLYRGCTMCCIDLSRYFTNEKQGKKFRAYWAVVQKYTNLICCICPLSLHGPKLIKSIKMAKYPTELCSTKGVMVTRSSLYLDVLSSINCEVWISLYYIPC